MQKLIDLLYKIYDIFKQYLLFWVLTNKKDKATLNKNKNLKDKHKGERCFILGNGPSLSKENLSLLADETVFAVNQISRNKQYNDFKTSYYFCVDDNFFKVDPTKEEDVEMLSSMQKVLNDDKDVVCCYLLKHKKIVDNNGLSNANTFFLLPGLYLFDNYKDKIDLTRFIPSFGTVVQYAIYTAIYMGFKEIYILGCDSTGIMSTLNAAMGEDNNTYSYEVTENEKKRMEAMVKHSKVEDYAYSYYMTLKGFSLLSNYCKDQHIKLINLSKTTVLDMMEREKLENVIFKDERSN